MKAIRKEVAYREWNSGKKEIEALYKDRLYTLEWDKVKLMRDIREEGSHREENRRYQELLIEERTRLNKKFELVILALDEKYKNIKIFITEIIKGKPPERKESNEL